MMMTENEKLRCIADLPMDRCSTENDYRLSAAKAIALGALSQQAEPTCSDERPCVSCFSDDGACLAEPAPAQDEREAFEVWVKTFNNAPERLLRDERDRYLDDWIQCRWLGWQAARASGPAQTEQQPIHLYRRKGRDAFATCGEDRFEELSAHHLFETKVVYAAPIAQTAPVQESEHHARLLGQALGECIVAAGIIRPDASPSGPELLMFADDLKHHLAEQTAPQDGAVIAYRTLDRHGNAVTDWIDGDPAGGESIVPGGSFQFAYSAPQPQQSALVEAAQGALTEIQAALEDAYLNAYPECCGQAHLECCGSPLQAWSEADQKTMERFAPHEKALRAALSAQGESHE